MRNCKMRGQLKRRLSEYEPLEPIAEASFEMTVHKRFRSVGRYKKHLKWTLGLAIPLALSPLLSSELKELRCAYVILLMALYWMLEILPLPVTSLIPVCLFPSLGVISTSQASMPYMKDTIMLYLAGMIMAAAVEKCNLHNRISLKILIIVGAQMRWLLLGFMITSMFISMWVSNMATALMLLPIVDSVVDEICHKLDDDEHGTSRSALATKRDEPSATFGMNRPNSIWEKNRRQLHHGLLLGVAYAANLGGTGSLIGSAPNLILYGIMEEKFPQAHVLSFATYMLYNVPVMILCVLFAWIYLYIVCIPKRFKIAMDEENELSIRQTIYQKHKDLGPMSFHEGAVLSLFTILIALWFFREPRFISGWSDLLTHGSMVKDATPAIGIVILMFFIPADPFNNFGGPALIEWKYAQSYVPWGVLILMGGSFSIASATDKSGLSRLIGESIAQLNGVHPFLLVVILTAATAFITEICSNTATASVFLPVAAYLATALRIHPLKLMMPITVASSFAFMLPVATPPNAMVYEHSNMPITYMFRRGLIMNLVCVFVEIVAVYTLGDWIFGLSNFPLWAARNTA